jgi:hypothetical protein
VKKEHGVENRFDEPGDFSIGAVIVLMVCVVAIVAVVI